MSLTAKGVLGEEGLELNERIGREVMEIRPRLTWEIFNEDETTTMIGFEREAAARKWWDEHPSIHADHHIGTLGHWPFYSSSIEAAMEVELRIDELGHALDYTVELHKVVAEDLTKEGRVFRMFDVIHATATQRCLAGLAVIADNKGGEGNVCNQSTDYP